MALEDIEYAHALYSARCQGHYCTCKIIYSLISFCNLIFAGTCCFSSAQLQRELYSGYFNTLFGWSSEQIASTSAGKCFLQVYICVCIFIYVATFVVLIFILLVSKFLCLVQNGKQMVQEGALTALASVADSSQVLFYIIYYSSWFFFNYYYFFCVDDSIWW